MGTDGKLNPHTRKVVAVLICGAILPLLDVSVVNVAVRPLSEGLHSTVGTAQWIITGYALSSTIAIVLTGFASQKFGETTLWRAALCMFTVASALCGLAWSIESLIGFRLLQGFAAGLSMPVMQTLLVMNAGKDQAVRAMTAVGLPAVIAPVLGPLVGGLLLDTLGWRSIFLINLPIGAIAIFLAFRVLPGAGRVKAEVRLDVRGFLLITPGLILAVYGLTTAGNSSSIVIPGVSLFAAGVLIVAYIVRSRYVEQPLLDPAVFAIPTFRSAWLTLILASIVFYGGLFLIPLYYQSVRGFRPAQVGFLLAFLGVGAMLSRSFANGLTSRWGTRVTSYIFILCTVIGTVPFAFSNANAGEWLIVEAVALIVRGAGIGALTMLTMSALYHNMPPDDIVHVSALSRVATQLGGALGVAVCALLLPLTGGIGHATFVNLCVITSGLAFTACQLPRGKVVRE
ncbi:DHA2 family efflux MFS transporter permease subunit [Corynebacterium lizhenjunii]|uniref:DHA2 family efflux MFS transporter permease subunit n=1 Tax=Corynebacterium lizhenjunii TaxID=2709394 RepID=UPI0013EBBAA5